MENVRLDWFTNDNSFPFFIQYGEHERKLFLHTHDNFSELVIVLSGSATHIVNGVNYPISHGDVFVINDNTAHGYADPVDFKICNIMFDPDMFFPDDLDIKRSVGFNALFVIEPHFSKEQKFSSRLRLSIGDFQYICNLISDMLFEYQGSSIGRKTLLHAKFLHIVVMLARAYGEASETMKSNIFYLADTVAYMQNHFTEQIKVADLAKMTNLSERHFSRIFSDMYKTSPNDYIMKLRVDYAKNLLLTTDMSITEISERSGFQSSNYYARLFRKLYNMSPMEFRKTNLG